jgi:hypothetical protein
VNGRNSPPQSDWIALIVVLNCVFIKAKNNLTASKASDLDLRKYIQVYLVNVSTKEI